MSSKWVWKAINNISGKYKRGSGFEGPIPLQDFNWKEYNAYFVMLMLSRMVNSNGYPDAVNTLHEISFKTDLMRPCAKYSHYLTLYALIPKTKRTYMKQKSKKSKWTEEQIKMICHFFYVSKDRALEYLEDMPPKESKKIFEMYENNTIPI